MGVNKLLKAGIENEEQQIKSAGTVASVVEKTEEPIAEKAPAAPPVEEKKPPKEEKKPASKKKNTNQENKGGRPTNKEKGIKSRKQYTLTLKEDTYKMILDKAGEEELSFAKYMERAALEYIKNHND